MEYSFNIKTAFIFLSGFLVFGATNSYAQTFSPSMQNLDFIDIEEMKMMIYLPNTWQSTFQNGVVEMWDTQNPIAGLAGALIPQAGTIFPSADTPIDEVGKNFENSISSDPNFVALLGSYGEPSLNAYSISSQFTDNNAMQMFDNTFYKISNGYLYYFSIRMPAEIAKDNTEIVSFLTTYFVVGEEYDSLPH
jgi:hypothetical protein